MTEYTLEVWDGITGQWFVADSAVEQEGLDPADGLAEHPDESWRIIRTEIVAQGGPKR